MAPPIAVIRRTASRSPTTASNPYRARNRRHELVLGCLRRVAMPGVEKKASPAEVQYDDIPRTADERATLVAFLEWQRSTLKRKCAGLTAEQLRRRSAARSTLSLLGLIRHITGMPISSASALMERLATSRL